MEVATGLNMHLSEPLLHGRAAGVGTVPLVLLQKHKSLPLGAAQFLGGPNTCTSA